MKTFFSLVVIFAALSANAQTPSGERPLPKCKVIRVEKVTEDGLPASGKVLFEGVVKGGPLSLIGRESAFVANDHDSFKRQFEAKAQNFEIWVLGNTILIDQGSYLVSAENSVTLSVDAGLVAITCTRAN